MKAVILAGGFGTRISEETALKPKPMVEIGNKPILWHILKIYSYFNINEFIICCGYKGYVIKEFFANYFLHTCKSYDFNEFVRKVFDGRPGFVSEMYSQYAHNEINFVGKQENLADDLIYFLMQQEYSIKIEDIQKSPRQNVSVAQKIKWDPQLREEVKDSEKMALLRYDYS